jgi:predicted RNA binding protein YcfA (HicA-like mRNA interferase family)
MKLPRDLSGRALVVILTDRFGYCAVHQRGSHIVLETSDPSRHRVVVPDHHELRIGTLNSVLRAVAAHKGIDRGEILEQ